MVTKPSRTWIVQGLERLQNYRVTLWVSKDHNTLKNLRPFKGIPRLIMPVLLSTWLGIPPVRAEAPKTHPGPASSLTSQKPPAQPGPDRSKTESSALRQTKGHEVLSEVLGILQGKPFLTPPLWRVPTQSAILRYPRIKELGQKSRACEEIVPLVQSFLADVGPSLFYVPMWDYQYSVLQNAFDPEDRSNRSWVHQGVKLIRKGPQMFVEEILAGSPADEAGLTPGDEILGIKGMENPVFADSPTETRTSWTVRRSPNGISQHIPLPPSLPGTTALDLDSLIARHMEKSTRILTSSSQKNKVLYLPLTATHRGEFFEALRKSLRALNITVTPQGPAFEGKPLPTIIDLRGPFGPVGPSGFGFISELNLIPSFDEAHRKETITVLVDHTTLGGREWLAHMLKVKARATLIGSTTGGMWASSEWIGLKTCPGGLLLPSAMTRSPFPEGIGLEPDLKVKPALIYRQGYDPVLAMALVQGN